MGVMECSRPRCENVMCMEHIEDYGYICNQCFKEINEKGILGRALKLYEKLQEDAVRL